MMNITPFNGKNPDITVERVSACKRVCILGGVITLLFLLLAARIAMLQLIPDSTLKEAAFRQRVSGMDVERRRGNILDRNNIPFTNREIKYTALIKQPVCLRRKKGRRF